MVSLAFPHSATRLAADFSAIRSKAANVGTSKVKRSAASWMTALSTNWSISCSPSPSMFMALREANSSSPRFFWAGQLIQPPEQRATASSSGRMMGAPQTGQWVGMMNSRASSGRFSKTDETTSGMTSAARRTMTVSPIRMSFRLTSSSLCRVALVTVTPPTKTGFNRATGVMAPVRPTCTSISSTWVSISWAGNLCASAKRGACETKPSFCCCASRLTL